MRSVHLVLFTPAEDETVHQPKLTSKIQQNIKLDDAESSKRFLSIIYFLPGTNFDSDADYRLVHARIQ